MATYTLHILSAFVLCLATLSLSTGSQSEDSNAQADSAPSRLASSSLAHILRRRSAELQAPPHIYASRLASYLRPSPSKRDPDGGYWIWMPAHGYMSVPRDEVVSSSGDKDSMGNLLRYGRK
ncbi:uncharacterized protein [Littorina saxatilis]|uniref:Uncharacterized protein n=1 Tax=Littorina saxatilis TaxID=31220 RepID=A0AAN9AMX1_9CAEN